MKKTKKHSRRRRRMSEATPLSAKRRTRRKKRSLSEGLSAIVGTHGANAVSVSLGGFLGGYASGFVTNIVTGGTANKTTEGLINVGGALALAYFGMPNVGAGVLGAYAERLRVSMQTMSEGYDYANERAFEENTNMPVFMDEEGNAVMVSEEGEMYYLEETTPLSATAPEFLAETPQFLAESYLPGYIPGSYGY